ncbi:MAG: MG2 domain-containing protein, partial [Candidatus Hydrogenedentes bacterium]|nr:MG2 domain-containing protein [Candidatus Hydrogenedentota bacterium]
MKINWLRTYVALAALVVFVAIGAGQGGLDSVLAQGQEGAGRVDRSQFELRPEGGRLVAHTVIHNPRNVPSNELFKVVVRSMAGQDRVSGSKRLQLKPGDNAIALPLNGLLRAEHQSDSVVKYTLGSGANQERGGFLLIDTLPQLETRLVGFPDMLVGSTASIQLVALNHATGAPVAGADAELTLVRETDRFPLYKGKTNANGSLEATFAVLLEYGGNCGLEIRVAAAGYGEDKLEQPVSVKKKTKILLSTDKPQYQPGQFIEMRALSLNAGDLKPAAEQALTFEVMDGKGNKVFKESLDTDKFGIASARFQLATEVNLGGYIVRAILGEDQSEKTVTVDRYVLPKFEIEVSTDRNFYRPGDTLKGEIQSDYFFGKPVAGGTVKITASTFVVNFETFSELEGTLDENGHWSFSLPLPKHFVGTELEQGQASVRLEVEITDTADHIELKSVMKSVAASDIQVHVIAEGGSLAPGVENEVYVLVARPDGSPVEDALVTVSSGQLVAKIRVETDA